MTDSPDITEVKECFRAGDDAKLLDAFQRFIASDKWLTGCYKWGEENAEELFRIYPAHCAAAAGFHSRGCGREVMSKLYA